MTCWELISIELQELGNQIGDDRFRKAGVCGRVITVRDFVGLTCFGCEGLGRNDFDFGSYYVGFDASVDGGVKVGKGSRVVERINGTDNDWVLGG